MNFLFPFWREWMLSNTNLPKPIASIDLSRSVREDAQIEWNEWLADYRPENGLAGKTILSVGAGEGEDCAFFFAYGAQKVFCIESDLRKINRLMANSEKMRWHTEIIEGGFRLEHLKLPFDFAKIDCEGCESILLSLDSLPPMALEIHSKPLFEIFRFKFPTMKFRKRNWWRDLWIGKING